MKRPNRGWGAGLRHGAVALLLAAIFADFHSENRIAGSVGSKSDCADQISDLESVNKPFCKSPSMSVKGKFGFVQNGGNNLGAPKLGLSRPTPKA